MSLTELEHAFISYIKPAIISTIPWAIVGMKCETNTKLDTYHECAADCATDHNQWLPLLDNKQVLSDQELIKFAISMFKHVNINLDIESENHIDTIHDYIISFAHELDEVWEYMQVAKILNI